MLMGELMKGHAPMKLRSHCLRPAVARGIAVLCAAVCVSSAHTLQAGINVWTSHGPGSVGITALALDPAESGRLYAGTSDGRGVFKSTDGGGTWDSIGLLGTDYVHALAIDPATEALYAGTEGGVFKSTDGGGTWSAVNTGLHGGAAEALVIDPTTPDPRLPVEWGL